MAEPTKVVPPPNKKPDRPATSQPADKKPTTATTAEKKPPVIPGGRVSLGADKQHPKTATKAKP